MSLTIGDIQNEAVPQEVLEHLNETLTLLQKRLEPPQSSNNSQQLLKPWITNHILTFSLFWQILNIIVLEVMDAKLITDNWEIDLTVITMAIFQTLQLMLIVVFSIKLVKQVLHKTVTGWFLVQSYLSTVMLYAGIYLLLYRVDHSCFSGVGSTNNPTSSAVLHYIRLLYFSCTTMTGIGFGDIVPTKWFSELVVTTEMLLSVTFVAVIFSLGMRHFSS